LRVIVTPVWLSAYVNNPDYDFYDIIIQVWNEVYTTDIEPSALQVRVDLEGARTFRYWQPTTAFAEKTSTLESPCNATLHIPAGEVLVGSYMNQSGLGVYHIWRVQGEVKGRFVPIFEQKAEFCLYRIQVPEGSGLRSITTVTLVWSYRSGLQVYPVADQTVVVEAHHA
jgi:hypothetical protein